MKTNEIGPVGQVRWALALPAPKISRRSVKRLQESQLIGRHAGQLSRSDLDAELLRALETGAGFFVVTENAAEQAVFEIRVCLSQWVRPPATQLERFFEERNTVKVRAQAEDLAETSVDLGQRAR